MSAEQVAAAGPSSAWERPDEPFRASAFVLAGVTVFTLQDVVIKWLSGAYPVYEIVLVRSLVAMAALALFASLNGGLGSLRPRRPLAHLTRGLCAFAAYTTYYLALASLPLAEAVALFFCAPLVITALSVPVLGERVGWRRWCAVGAGFLGTLVMLRPGTGVFDPAGLLAVAAAGFYAVQSLVARRCGAGETGAAMAFSGALTYVPLSLAAGLAFGGGAGVAGAAHPSVAFLLRAWSVPGPADLGIMAVSGLTFAVAFYGVSQAYRLTRASNVAPFEYATVPLGAVAGYLVWREVPDAATVLGATLVVGSGLYVFHREALRGRRLTLRRTFGLRPRV